MEVPPDLIHHLKIDAAHVNPSAADFVRPVGVVQRATLQVLLTAGVVSHLTLVEFSVARLYHVGQICRGLVTGDRFGVQLRAVILPNLQP